MRNRLQIACGVIAASSLSLADPAYADDDFQCSNGIVHVGEQQQEVLQKCGPPTEAKRIDRTYRTKWGHARAIFDVWTYNRGPYEFVRVLTFERNILRTIDVGPYGN
jgi:hypothetical protein